MAIKFRRLLRPVAGREKVSGTYPVVSDLWGVPLRGADQAQMPSSRAKSNGRASPRARITRGTRLLVATTLGFEIQRVAVIA